MIFHTSNLHLLDMIGQGIKMCSHLSNSSSVLKFVLSILPTVIAGEFSIVYRARLTKSTLRKTEHKIVAVKTIKGKIQETMLPCMHMSTTEILFVCHNLNVILYGSVPPSHH